MLLSEIEKYGNRIADKNYQSETAVLDDLIHQYKNDSKLNAAVNILHLGEWFDYNETTNIEFKALISERDSEIAERPKEKTRDALDACIEKYNALILHLSAYGITQPSELHNTVRNKINQIIERYNTTQRRSK